MDKAISIETGLQTLVLKEEIKNDSNFKNLSATSKLKLFLTNITIEPILICIVLPGVMLIITTQNLNLEKGCRVNLALGEDICNALTTRNESFPGYKKHEAAVQRLAANLAIWKNIIQSIIPAIFLLFLGSWSDRRKKRKPCILNPIVGEMVTCIGILLCIYFFFELPMEANLLAEAIPIAISGGPYSLFLGLYSYISGITSEKTRTVRIGAIHTLFNISYCMGVSLSGIVFERMGFYGVYSLGLSMYLCGYIYGTFFIKDIWELEDTSLIVIKEKKRNFFLDFFDFKHVSKTIKTTFKQNGNNRRRKMFLLVVLVMLVQGPINGECNISYYLVRYKYGWSPVDYSIFSTFQFVVNSIGALSALVLFTKILKLKDATLGMISCTSKICGTFIFAFAPSSLYFYLGGVAEMMSGIAFISIRSIVSKMVPSEELGAANSVIGCTEAFGPLIYGPLYNKIYAITLNVFPSSYYLFSSGLMISAFTIFLWIFIDQRRSEGERQSLKCQNETLVKPDYSEMNPNSSRLRKNNEC